MPQQTPDDIKAFMEKVRQLSDSPENRERAGYRQLRPETARDHWRGTPRYRSERPVTL